MLVDQAPPAFCVLCNECGHWATSHLVRPQPPSGVASGQTRSRRALRCVFCGKQNHTIDRCYARADFEAGRCGGQRLPTPQHPPPQATYTHRPPQRPNQFTPVQWRPNGTPHNPSVTNPPPSAATWQPRTSNPNRSNNRPRNLVNAIQSKSKAPLVKSRVKVGQFDTVMLWDTGAAVSVIDEAFAVSLLAINLARVSPRWPLRTDVKLYAAHQVHMPSSSPVDIEFFIKSVTFWETFIPVKNLGVPLIVCTSFMMAHRVQIYLDNFTLKIPEHEISLPVTAEFRYNATEVAKSLLFPKTLVTIPAHAHVKLDLIHSPGDPLYATTRTIFIDNRWHNIVSPNRMIRVTPGVQTCLNGVISGIWVSNLSGQDIFLDSFSAIADAYPVEAEKLGVRSTCEVDTDMNYFFEPQEPHFSDPEYPDHLEDSQLLRADTPLAQKQSFIPGSNGEIPEVVYVHPTPPFQELDFHALKRPLKVT